LADGRVLLVDGRAGELGIEQELRALLVRAEGVERRGDPRVAAEFLEGDPVVSFGCGSLWKTTVSNAGGSGHQLRPATDCTVFAETSAASNASAVSGVGARGLAAALPAATSSTSASSPARNALTLRPSPAGPAEPTSSQP